MNSFSTVVQAQRALFDSGKPREINGRRNALIRLKNTIRQNESKILDALHRDLGKNAFEAYASEVGIVQSEIKNALKHLIKYSSPLRKPTPIYLWPASSYVQYEPLGVCLIISPWNYPFQLTMAPLIGAIASGNCAVVKPSERSRHTSQLLSKLIAQTFAPEHVTVLLADKTESAALLNEPFDKIFFTGSKTVGRLIYQAAAKKMIPVTLELGGKNPCIVEPDANLDIAAARIVWGKFYNAGQTCVAPDYLLVHERVKEALIPKMVSAIDRQFGNFPKDSPYYGRLIDEAHCRQMQQLLVGSAVRHGGELSVKDRYLSPTIIDNVDQNSPLMEDEIFGPIFPVLSYRQLDEAIQCIRRQPKPLALYLFSKNPVVQKQIFEQCSFGGGCINDTLVHFSSPHLPVGGIGESGIGRYRGHDSFRAFSNIKTVVHTPYRPHMALRFPPFPPWKQKLLKRFMG